MAVVLVGLGLASPRAVADQAADVAAIRAAAAAYRAALAKGDAAAVRRAWTADGDIVDGWGNLLSAADVADAGGGPDGGPRPEIQVGETRLRLVTTDVAIEDGEVDVVLPGNATPLEGWFSAIWVKQGGEWKLAGLREAERHPEDGADSLDDLDWMVGDWTLVSEEAVKDAVPGMEMTVRWDGGRMFLVRDVRLVSPAAVGDKATLDVQQRIGWDPLVGRIRGWSFATDGSRGETTWFRDGNSWIAKVTTIQPDGRQATAVHIYTYDGRDRCAWRTMQDPFAADDRAPIRATWVRKPKGGVQ